jgi:CspA family cold shock protein
MKEKENGKQQGVVKWFNRVKGYGFIGREDGPDVFVHHSEIKSDGSGRTTLREGQNVRFEVQEARKGPKAINVMVL